LSFRRNFGIREEAEFEELTDLLALVQLPEVDDSSTWVFERSGTFTTSSLYKELTFTGFSDRWLVCMWKTKLPLKIIIFLCQVINDKIQSGEQLKKEIGLVQSAQCVVKLNILFNFFPTVQLLNFVGVFVEMYKSGLSPHPIQKTCGFFVES
jgi:hypothetical protein